MTDERQGGALFGAIAGLPRGSGIVFRHYRLEAGERRALFDTIRRAAERQGHLLLLAGTSEQARTWGADGSHGHDHGSGLRTAPAHNLAELRGAEKAGASLIFLSPVFETRSHPQAVPLGPDGFAALAAQTSLPVIALGGMNEARFRALDGAYGWAGIDAWTEG